MAIEVAVRECKNDQLLSIHQSKSFNVREIDFFFNLSTSQSIRSIG